MNKYKYYNNEIKHTETALQDGAKNQDKKVLADQGQRLFVFYKIIIHEKELVDDQKQTLLKKIYSLVISYNENLPREQIVRHIIKGDAIFLSEFIAALYFFNEMLDIITKEKPYLSYLNGVIAQLDIIIAQVYDHFRGGPEAFILKTTGLDEQKVAIRLCYMLIEQVGQIAPTQCSQLKDLFYILARIFTETLNSQINDLKSRGNSSGITRLILHVHSVYEMLQNQFLNQDNELKKLVAAHLGDAIAYLDFALMTQGNKQHFENYIDNVLALLTGNSSLHLAQAYLQKLRFQQLSGQSSSQVNYQLLYLAYQALMSLPTAGSKTIQEQLLYHIVNGYIKLVNEFKIMPESRETLHKSLTVVQGCLGQLLGKAKATQSLQLDLQSVNTQLKLQESKLRKSESTPINKLVSEIERLQTKPKSEAAGKKNYDKKVRKLQNKKQNQINLLLSQCLNYMDLAVQLGCPDYEGKRVRSLIWLELKPAEYVQKARIAFNEAEQNFTSIVNPDDKLITKLRECRKWLEKIEQSFPADLKRYYKVRIDADIVQKVEAALANKTEEKFTMASVISLEC